MPYTCLDRRRGDAYVMGRVGPVLVDKVSDDLVDRVREAGVPEMMRYRVELRRTLVHVFTNSAQKALGALSFDYATVPATAEKVLGVLAADS